MTETMQTAEALREQAVRFDREAAESFERCDTDGFLSQWASGISARKARLEADIVEAGGKAEFPALFDADGNLVAARLVDTLYGLSWCLIDETNPHGPALGWFNSSKHRDNAKRIAANVRKGYRLGRVMAPARAEIGGSGKGLAGAASCYVYARRMDGGFSYDVEIVSIEGLIGEPSDCWN